MMLKKMQRVARTEKNKEFRLLVCGSRDWPLNEDASIRHEIDKVMNEHHLNSNQLCVITGSTWEDENGADSVVERVCRTQLGVACAIFRAPWVFMEKAGNKRAAGPIRNGWMLKWGKPDMILAFHPYLPNSRGTKNMCEQARVAGIPVRVIEK